MWLDGTARRLFHSLHYGDFHATRGMSPGLKSKVWVALAVILLLALIAQSAVLYPKLRVRNAENAALRDAVEAANRTISESDAPTPGRTCFVYKLARLSYRPPEQTLPMPGRSVRKVSNTVPV